MHRRRGFLKRNTKLFLGLGVGLTAGAVVHTLVSIPDWPEYADCKDHCTLEKSVAIVATGTPERIEAGLKLVKDGKVRRVLISGVKERDIKRKVIDKHPIIVTLPAGSVEIDYQSQNTSENAINGLKWLKDQEGVNNCVWVTSDWHMARLSMNVERNKDIHGANGHSIKFFMEPVTDNAREPLEPLKTFSTSINMPKAVNGGQMGL
jgi:uncharacterized SAM-binding protein YcdF (DUF218 family)